MEKMYTFLAEHLARKPSDIEEWHADSVVRAEGGIREREKWEDDSGERGDENDEYIVPCHDSANFPQHSFDANLFSRSQPWRRNWKIDLVLYYFTKGYILETLVGV